MRTLTKSIASMLRSITVPLDIPDLRQPPPSAISHYRGFLPSLSAELLKLRSDPTHRREEDLSEEALFLAVSLSDRRLQQSDRVESSRLRERAAMLFAVVRKVIGDGPPTRMAPASALSTLDKVLNAWAAWHAAVEEGEDRLKALAVDPARSSTSAQKILGLRTWGWLALGVMVEQLEAFEKENIEVITID